MNWKPLLIYKHETIIQQAFGAFGKPYALVHVPECEEVAGAGIRHVKECWRVVHMFDGNRHSKAFSTLDLAKIEFDTWTKPIVEQRESRGLNHMTKTYNMYHNKECFLYTLDGIKPAKVLDTGYTYAIIKADDNSIAIHVNWPTVARKLDGDKTFYTC